MIASRTQNAEGHRAVFIRRGDYEVSALENGKGYYWIRFWSGDRNWSRDLTGDEFEVFYHLAAPAAATKET